MSMDATVWAFRQRGLPPIQKLALLILADCHEPENGGYITPAYLCYELEVTETEAAAVIEGLVDRRVITLRHGDAAPFPAGPLMFDMPIQD